MKSLKEKFNERLAAAIKASEEAKKKDVLPENEFLEHSSGIMAQFLEDLPKTGNRVNNPLKYL